MKAVVGLGSCGIAAGASKVYEKLENEIKKRELSMDLDITGCVGMCHLEPIVDVYDDDGEMERYVNVSIDKIGDFLDQVIAKKSFEEFKIDQVDTASQEKQVKIATGRCGYINPEDIEEYKANGGYKAIEKCLKELTQEEIIEEIKISGLRGRGGAGFP
ncbi:MAG TPA: NADH-quinone oxidoreductase subunit F, partial [Eubacteriaceae bacterium]|nr:NADH-quinone oxidoreductase subunit F [Eubacteriaceae bacterium]